MDGGESDALNLGTGNGYSVREVINIASSVTGQEIPVTFGERRAGDPPFLVAEPGRAAESLGWQPEISFNELVNEMTATDLEIAERDALIAREGYTVYNYKE